MYSLAICFAISKYAMLGIEKVGVAMFKATREGEAVIVRPLTQTDYKTWLASFLARKPKQHRYDEGLIDMSICTLDWFDALVLRQQQLAQQDDTYVFGIFRKADGAHLGAIDFTTLLRGEFQWARIGYTIHNQFWRQGYGQEALSLALILGQQELGYHRIEAHINLDNEASIGLAQAVGMHDEGIRKGFIFEEEQWVDHRIFVKIG